MMGLHCCIYKDGVLSTAQVVSVLAFLASIPIFWTFVVALVCMLVIQITTCCCRLKKLGFQILTTMSVMVALVNFGYAISIANIKTDFCSPHRRHHSGAFPRLRQFENDDTDDDGGGDDGDDDYGDDGYYDDAVNTTDDGDEDYEDDELFVSNDDRSLAEEEDVDDNLNWTDAGENYDGSNCPWRVAATWMFLATFLWMTVATLLFWFAHSSRYRTCRKRQKKEEKQIKKRQRRERRRQSSSKIFSFEKDDSDDDEDDVDAIGKRLSAVCHQPSIFSSSTTTSSLSSDPSYSAIYMKDDTKDDTVPLATAAQVQILEPQPQEQLRSRYYDEPALQPPEQAPQTTPRKDHTAEVYSINVI